MTTAEMLRNEGIEKGIEQGRVDMLRQVLTAKFGDLPAPVVDRLRAASAEELSNWVPRVLTATTLAEIFS